MSKEEKAKEYARSIIDESVENYMGDEIFDSHIDFISQCYTAGYTQAEQDLSSQLTACKEALREAIPYIEDAIKLHKSNGVHQEFISEDREFLAKAKTLIE